MGKKDKKKDKKVKEESKKTSSGSVSGETTKYSGGIALSKLKHVIMTKKNKKGKKIKGLFIPIEQNYLVEGKEGAVYMNINIIARSEQDDYGQNGFIAQNGNKSWKDCSEEEQNIFRDLPILGNIKNFESSQSSGSSDSSGSKGHIDEDDDLPF